MGKQRAYVVTKGRQPGIFAPWDEVDFGAGSPCALDHGAIAPVVCVFVRRPRGDGVNVYASLPKHLVGTFSECLFVNETASVLVEE